MNRHMRSLNVASSIVVVALLAACTTPSAGPPTSNTPTADASPSAAPTPTIAEIVAVDPDDYDFPWLGGEGVSFNSPDDNIACGIRPPQNDSSYEYGCYISDYTYTDPPQPDDIQVPCEHGFWASERFAPKVLCSGEPATYAGVRDYGDPSVLTLEVGTSITFNETTCVSETDGMLCTGPDGHGFRLSAESYELF